MAADRCNYSLKISLIKSKGFSSKRRWIHVRRERERGRRRERERRSGSAYLANAEKWECLHREKSIKSHRGPRAPRNDKSYLYNATFSRRLINITVFFIAAECLCVLWMQENSPKTAVHKTYEAAAEKRANPPFMCVQAGVYSSHMDFLAVHLLWLQIWAPIRRLSSPLQWSETM